MKKTTQYTLTQKDIEKAVIKALGLPLDSTFKFVIVRTQKEEEGRDASYYEINSVLIEKTEEIIERKPVVKCNNDDYRWERDDAV